MWEGSYGAEPFDLRLTVLRMFRCLGWIALFTLCGTVLFGGGYYVKNVLLGEKPRYEQTITCKLEYTDQPVQSGDYYINEMTWNTYVNSDEFRELLRKAAVFGEIDVPFEAWLERAGGKNGKEYGEAGKADGQGEGSLARVLSAAVASDIHVPSFTVSTIEQEQAQRLSQAVQEVLTGAFVERIPELAAVSVIDVTDVSLVWPNVRPVRAVVLSALLSCFFTVVFFLLREIGADSIWLPATLGRRYGLKALGTIESRELAANAGYLFKGSRRIALCSARSGIDLQAVAKVLQEKLQQGEKAESAGSGRMAGSRVWIPCDVWAGCLEAGSGSQAVGLAAGSGQQAAEALRQADTVLLVIPAGLHEGKPLEYLLEFFRTQDITVTAALLWQADEALIRGYYFGNVRRDGMDVAR